MTDPAELIRQASRPRVVRALCLDGDLQQRWDDLNDRLLHAAARVAAAPSLKELGEPQKIQDELDALAPELEERQLTFTLEGLPHHVYVSLLDDHPPRKDHDGDRANGWNASTFLPALVKACTVDPDLDDDTWTALFDQITSGQLDTLARAALDVNRRKVSIPFSSTVSTTTRG